MKTTLLKPKDEAIYSKKCVCLHCRAHFKVSGAYWEVALQSQFVCPECGRFSTIAGSARKEKN